MCLQIRSRQEMIAAVAARNRRGVQVDPVIVVAAHHMVSAFANPPSLEVEASFQPVQVNAAGPFEIDCWVCHSRLLRRSPSQLFACGWHALNITRSASRRLDHRPHLDGTRRPISIVFRRTVRLVGPWSRTDCNRVRNRSFHCCLCRPCNLLRITRPGRSLRFAATGRVAAAALALLAVDSIFTWSVTPDLIEAAVLTAIPAVVAIRVIRGFPRSRELASATFASILAVASFALSQIGLFAGQASAGIVVSIALAATGILSLALAGLRSRLGGEPVIAIPRWPVALVALRNPSRYRTHRQYR